MKKVLASLALVISGTAGGLALATSGGGAAASRPHVSAATVAMPSFALLGKSPVASTGDLIQVIGDPGAAAWQAQGVDPAQARETSVAGHQLWIAAGPSNVCVAVQRIGVGGVSSCTSTLIADSNGEAFTIPNPDGSVTVAGILPDGAASLSMDAANGQVTKLEMSDSAFWATSTPTPTALHYTQNGTSRTTSLTVER